VEITVIAVFIFDKTETFIFKIIYSTCQFLQGGSVKQNEDKVLCFTA